MTTSVNNPVEALTEYELRHLVAHLAAAGRDEDVHRLLALETGEGRNAWYEAREQLGQTAGYLADVARAWRLAEEEFAECQSPISIARQCRYALVLASINSLAKNIPASLLVALVEKGICTPAQGLAYARQIPDPYLRIRSLVGLASHLPEVERIQARREALATVREFSARHENGGAQVIWLIKLAVQLPEDERVQVLREAIRIAQEIPHGIEQGCALAHVVAHLPKTLLPEAVAAARAIADVFGRACVSRELASNFPEAAECVTILQEALTTIRESENEIAKARALDLLASSLPESLLPEALAIAQKIRFDELRSEVLARLGLRLAEPGYCGEALARAREIPDKQWRGLVLTRIASHLPAIERTEVFQEILALSGETERIAQWSYLLKMSQTLEVKEWPASFKVWPARWVPPKRVQLLEEVVPLLPEPLLRELFVAVQQTVGMIMINKNNVLLRLATTMAELGKPDEALAWVREAMDERSRAKALLALAPYLSGPLLQETLEMARAIAIKYKDEPPKYEGDPPGMLAEPASYLPEVERIQPLREALAAARNIANERQRVSALTELAPRLPEAEASEVLREALATARKIADRASQSRALAGLVSYMPEVERPQAIYEKPKRRRRSRA
jgi:hypothetical protein